MHRQEKNKFNKEEVLWPHTPERSQRVCLARGSTGLLAGKDKGATDPSLGYRGRLGGSLLESEAQLSKRPCQSCRDQGQGQQHPFFRQREVAVLQQTMGNCQEDRSPSGESCPSESAPAAVTKHHSLGLKQQTHSSGSWQAQYSGS